MSYSKEEENEISGKVLETALKCTVQILVNKEGTYKPHGSGVLFNFKEEYFLLTAGHVFEDVSLESLYASIPDLRFQLGGELLRTENSKYADYGLIKLHERSIANLKKHYEFLEIGDIELGHKQKVLPEKNMSIDDEYFISGYPASKSKQKYGNAEIWKSKMYCFTSSCSRSNIEEFVNQGYKYHLFVDTQKNVQAFEDRRKMSLPKLNGMSGCGVWDAMELKPSGDRNIKLVGLFVEVPKGTMLILRVDILIKVIRDNFDLKKLPNPRI